MRKSAISLFTRLICSDVTDVQAFASYALANLAHDNLENQNAIRESGAIPPLTKLLSSSDPDLQGNASDALLSLAQDNGKPK